MALVIVNNELLLPNIMANAHTTPLGNIWQVDYSLPWNISLLGAWIPRAFGFQFSWLSSSTDHKLLLVSLAGSSSKPSSADMPRLHPLSSPVHSLGDTFSIHGLNAVHIWWLPTLSLFSILLLNPGTCIQRLSGYFHLGVCLSLFCAAVTEYLRLGSL